MTRIRSNVASLFASEVARRLLGFLSVAYMARTLGVEGFGMVMVGMSVLSYVSLMGSGGLHMFGTRNVARGDASIDPGAVLGARLLNTIIVLGAASIVTVAWVEPPELVTVILLTSLSAILHSLFLEWYFQGREHMAETAIARTLAAILYLGFIVVCVRSAEDLEAAAAAVIVGDLGSTGYLLVRYRKSYGTLRVSFRSWGTLMRSAWPFGAGSILAQLSVNLPVLAIAALLGSAEAGVFSGANKLVFFVLMADRILGTMLLPVTARLQQEKDERLSPALSSALHWILLIGLPLCIGGSYLAPEIVALVFGEAFQASADVLRILVWYAVLTMIHTVYTAGVLATGGERRYRNVMAVSAALYVIGVSGGIVSGGVMGAAAGMLLAEGITVVLMERAMQSALTPPRPSRFGRIVMAGIVLAAGLPFLSSAPVVLSVGLGAALYATAAIILQAVTINELRQLIQRPA